MWFAGWIVGVLVATSLPKGTFCDPKSACLANEALRVIEQVRNDAETLEDGGKEGDRCSEERLQRFRDSIMADLAQCDDTIRPHLQGLFDAAMESLQAQCEVRRRCECCATCDVFEPSHPCGETITLTEGGDDYELQFKILRSPRDICGNRRNCQVILDFASTPGDQPRCPNKGPIEQIVFRDGCSMEIKGTNWGRIRSVHLAAKIDRVIDGQQTRRVNVLMKTVVNGVVEEERSLCEYQVVVIDKDTNNFCSSTNDPHITTFDGHYYHNFIEGEFVLYQHDHLPYQVDMMYQHCHNGVAGATCNCGVAVKSGDTVFVTEKCRRHGQNCVPGSCAGNQLRTQLYKHGAGLQSHMRIFNRDAGSGFDVLLPHGTLVKIRTSGPFINVWVYPSAADWQKTKGLCGFYDGIKKNDLRQPDGSTYTGAGTGHGQYPDAFSMRWKVPIPATLFYGVPKAPYTPGWYSHCSSGGAHENPVCNRNTLVDTCCTDTVTEIHPLHLGVIDLDQVGCTHARCKRDVTSPETFISSLDLDPLDEPTGEVVEFNNSWSEENATSFCDDAIKTQLDWARKCLTVPGLNPDLVVQNCIDDIMISGTTEWMDTALQAMKLLCVHTMEVHNDFRQNEGRHLEQEIRDQLCPQDCSGHGRCQQGSCICNDGYVGADCHYREDTRPEDLSLPAGGLCNTRASDCGVITVFGDKFIASSNLTCHLQSVQVTESGLAVSNESSVTVLATYVSINQILCPAPAKGSYLVDVSNDGVTSSGRRILHIAFDPSCYNCAVSESEEAALCTRTTSGCVVDGQCYKASEDSPHSACLACNPGRSLDSFSTKASADCHTVEIIIAVCILVAVVTVIVIIGYCCRRKQKTQSRNVSHGKPI